MGIPQPAGGTARPASCPAAALLAPLLRGHPVRSNEATSLCAAQVKGFNVRRYMRDNKKRIPNMLEAISKLVSAGKLTAAYTE